MRKLFLQSAAFAGAVTPETGGNNHTWIWLVILGVAVADVVAIAIVVALNNRKKDQSTFSETDDSGENQ